MGSILSEYIIAMSTLNEDQQNMNWNQLRKHLNIQCHWDTFANVLRQHGLQSRRVPARKPPLFKYNKQYRFDFVRWALERIAAGDLFVFSDEMWVENGEIRTKDKVTMPRGTNSNKMPRTKPAKSFRYMVGGAFCYRYKGIFHIWQGESEEDRKENDAFLDQENRILSGRVEKKRQDARVPGTVEHRILQERNANVKRLNEIDPLPSGRKRQLRRPEWEFKAENKKREAKQGGIDWFLYRKEILWPKLYP